MDIVRQYEATVKINIMQDKDKTGFYCQLTVDDETSLLYYANTEDEAIRRAFDNFRKDWSTRLISQSK